MAMYSLVREFGGVNFYKKDLKNGEFVLILVRSLFMRTNVSYRDKDFSLGTVPDRNAANTYEYDKIDSIDGVLFTQMATTEEKKAAVMKIIATVGQAQTAPVPAKEEELIFVNTAADAETKKAELDQAGETDHRLIFCRTDGKFFRYSPGKDLEPILVFDDTQP